MIQYPRLSEFQPAAPYRTAEEYWMPAFAGMTEIAPLTRPRIARVAAARP
jgi:hypothetical protein